MQKYKDYQPTAFDPKGLNADILEIENFLVIPVIQTRNSKVLEKTNFQAAIKILDGESKQVQIHRFNHWGPGWFEIILINPNDKGIMEKAKSIEESLENYPILDDELYSQLEWNEMYDLWESMSLSEKIELCKDENVSIFSARSKKVPDGCYEKLSSWVN